MPNWVSNSIRITGDEQELQRFVEQAGRSYESRFHSYDQESGNYLLKYQTVESHLSFWNFVRPEDSILDEYYGEERQDLSLKEKLQYKTNHWYDWNIRNWGCKWDSSDVYFENWNGELAYDFETPWSFPEEAIRAMVAQYPTLSFSIRFLEEQGWGGEMVGENGELALVNEWDIPNTHEERMEYIGYCYCEESNELDYMYDDCPKKMEAEGANISAQR